MMSSPGPQSLAITHLIVIRHGETAWNRERRLQGQLDIPLNELGQAQARAVADTLAAEPIDAIYSSDLARTMQTAAPLAQATGLTVRADARLRERCYGVLEGMAYAEVAERRAEDFACWQARVPGWAPERGESLRGFHERAVEGVLALVRRHPGERIVMFTHGGVLDCLYREATDMTLEAPREHELLNAGINRLRCDGQRLTLSQWGDVTHLQAVTLDELDRRVP